MNGENTEVVVKDGENAAEIKVNAKDTSASVEAGSDAITVTVGGETTKKDGLSVTTVTNYKVDLSQKTKDEIKNAAGRGFNEQVFHHRQILRLFELKKYHCN